MSCTVSPAPPAMPTVLGALLAATGAVEFNDIALMSCTVSPAPPPLTLESDKAAFLPPDSPDFCPELVGLRFGAAAVQDDMDFTTSSSLPSLSCPFDRGSALLLPCAPNNPRPRP